MIASEAGADKNTLITGSLTTEDISNESSYEAETVGISVGAATNPKGKNPTGNLTPGLPMEESGGDSSSTKSAISEGTIIITDEAAQLARTGETAAEAIANLNRDTENAHNGPLDKNPDLNDLLSEQAEIADAAGKAGEAVAKTVGDIAKHFTDQYELAAANEEILRGILDDPNATEELKNQASELLDILTDPEAYERWSEGGAYKTALQAAGSALVAALGNGEALNAAMGAAKPGLVRPRIWTGTTVNCILPKGN